MKFQNTAIVLSILVKTSSAGFIHDLLGLNRNNSPSVATCETPVRFTFIDDVIDIFQDGFDGCPLSTDPGELECGSGVTYTGEVHMTGNLFCNTATDDFPDPAAIVM